MQEMAQAISQEFQPQGYKVPTKTIPKAVIWVGKFFDSNLKTFYPGLGRRIVFSGEKLRNELGVQTRPARESLIDTCYSLVELELVHRTQGYLGPPSSRPKEIAEGGEAQADPPQELQKAEQPKAESKPDETAESKPEETTESKPEETAESKPEERTESKPNETAESKPEETAEQPRSEN